MRGLVSDGGPVLFGQLLRELRLTAGLSQEALAERARMSSGGISVLERGTRRAPHRDTMALLADALELSDDDRRRFEAAAFRSGNARRRGNLAPDHSQGLGNLPFALTSFVGRERQTPSVRHHVLEQRLVTLTGVGGVGKTRLAIEACHGLAGEFVDGIWFVELSSLSDPELVSSRIVATVHPSSSGYVSRFRWIDSLIDKRCLLILDNCEHLLATCATIAKQLLERCPHVHVLATSRERLYVTGERVVKVEPLREPQAIEMFLERARNVLPELSMRDDDAATREQLHAIYTALDGLPLALELAAARLSSLSLKALAENLGERLALLRTADRAVVPRQQTMHALIDWSYGLLSRDEQQLFANLAVFRGGCTLDAVAAVASLEGARPLDVLDLLTSLVDKSLVVVDVHADESRYELLELLRDYALEKLKAAGEQESAVHRHAAFYLELAERLENRASMPDSVWRSHAQLEMGNWRAALYWTLELKNDVELGQRLAAFLSGVWMVFAAPEGRRWGRMALDLLNAQTPADVAARLQYNEALYALRAGEQSTALAAAQTVLPQYRRLHDLSGIGGALKVAGMSLVYLGRVSEGKPLVYEALENARNAGNLMLMASIEDCIASIQSIAGDFNGAKSAFAQSEAHYLEAGSERDALYASGGLAEAYYRAGDVSGAIQIADGALQKARSLDDPYLVMSVSLNLAEYLIAVDRFEDAARFAREALDFARSSQFEVTVAWALICIASASILQSHQNDAVRNEDLVRNLRVVGFAQGELTRFGAASEPAVDRATARVYDLSANVLGSDEVARILAGGSVMDRAEAIGEALKV